ncbi:polymer-forming cytoskeletal protein [Haloferacaceae archaeon DSL9]
MSFGADPLDRLSIPDGTTAEEHDLVTDGDALIGSQSTVEFGVRARNVAAGERTTFGGHIEADGDLRLDTWCRVDSDVLVGEDAYIGERVAIGGRLMVSGDLDIGDDVDIEDGFDANGWIVIRNPIPTLVFYFIVLSQLLRAGDQDAADELAASIAGLDSEVEPLTIPQGAHVSDDSWRVSTPAAIGDDCRLHGNIRAESITVGERNTVFGSLRARGDISVAGGTVVIGDVTSREGTVTLAADAVVRGDVSCDGLVVYEGADVEGTLRARGEMKYVRTKPEPPVETAAARESPAAEGTSVEGNADDEKQTGDEKQTDSDEPKPESTVEQSD